MRETKRLFRVAIATLFLVSPLLAFDQAEGEDSRANPEQGFAAINDSLLTAANTAIESTIARPSDANSIDRRQQAQAESVPQPKRDPSSSGLTRNEGLDALVETILTREGVPDQLAAVIQVESGGNPLALSPKGARGPWQLMPDTARRYGLRVDKNLDERIDLEKSTGSAARYLRDLYRQFGSWPLALAAYNTGEQNLQRAIAHARSRDFTTLSVLGYLPLETRNYVPSVLAAMGRQLPSALTLAAHKQEASFVYAMSEESGQ